MKKKGHRHIPEATYEALWARSGGQCEVQGTNCRSSIAGQIPHHMKLKSRGGTDAVENLLCVCLPCHVDITLERGSMGERWTTHRNQPEGWNKLGKQLFRSDGTADKEALEWTRTHAG